MAFGRLSKLVGGGGLIGGGSGIFISGIFGPTVLAEEKVEPPKYPWSHSGLTDSYDHARYTLEYSVVYCVYCNLFFVV